MSYWAMSPSTGLWYRVTFSYPHRLSLIPSRFRASSWTERLKSLRVTYSVPTSMFRSHPAGASTVTETRSHAGAASGAMSHPSGADA